MSISFNKQPGQKILELGGGDNPHEQSDIRVDVRAGQFTHFTADFEKPLPISSDEFDCVFCRFCLEHVSYPQIPNFLLEVYRVTKPGGTVIFITANTQAQTEWIKNHPEGWNGKSAFISASELLYGSQDYPENSHRTFFSPSILQEVFIGAGFRNVLTTPYGECETDIVIQANKPKEPSFTFHGLSGTIQSGGMISDTTSFIKNYPVTSMEMDRMNGDFEVVPDAINSIELTPVQTPLAVLVKVPNEMLEIPPEELYDRHYWNGGGKVGGYAKEGYWDFPVHEVTTRHILVRRPESVLELGAARGYIGKRLEDAGVRYLGMEVSKHCWMTRACDSIIQQDLCKPWGMEISHKIPYTQTTWVPENYDLAFSIAVFEHIPESKLPHILSELKRTTNRGLHGIDFGGHDDGFDKTHVTLRSHSWWRNLFDSYGLQKHEICDKEDLEKGEFPADVKRGDGKTKLALGTFTTMSHYGWVNIDIHDLGAFAQQHGYNYLRHDIRNGLPHATGSVDLIHSSHCFEHLTYEEGAKLLKECRRVIKPEGVIRFAVPDMLQLVNCYITDSLDGYNEISPTCESRKTQCGKFWELLHAGHSAAYDSLTLKEAFQGAGFSPHSVAFRESFYGEGGQQILRETLDQPYGGMSLFMEATPFLG